MGRGQINRKILNALNNNVTINPLVGSIADGSDPKDFMGRLLYSLRFPGAIQEVDGEGEDEQLENYNGNFVSITYNTNIIVILIIDLYRRYCRRE